MGTSKYIFTYVDITLSFAQRLVRRGPSLQRLRARCSRQGAEFKNASGRERSSEFPSPARQACRSSADRKADLEARSVGIILSAVLRPASAHSGGVWCGRSSPPPVRP